MPALPSHYDLSGRAALITGGAGLLGIEHAAALAMVGAQVTLADIDTTALEKAKAVLADRGYDDQIVTVTMDVTDMASIKKTCAAAPDQQLGIDILINNAAIDARVDADGVVGGGGQFESFSLDDWQREMDVGLTGAFLCAQVFGREMAARGAGVILNISSDLSVIAPDQRLYADASLAPASQAKKPVTYSVIKTGLIGLTRYLAAYWADSGVRVNAISPGGVENGQSDEFVTRLSALVPMGRMAVRDEYAGAIQFLCSDASRYMTGQNVIIDGGRSIL
jgi:NAD(P)-dependent dehydrogenase (short-subunit alcohol dehydrogenase family)